MRIQNNIAAMTAHRNMSIANAGNARSQEKLSSGLRINRAGDDAAGLSISEKMRGQIRGLNQASRNAQDGISLIQTAEGALNETQNILQRMRELSVQAANDTNTLADRNAIGEEISQLFEEIDRIAETTQFNEMNLLDGSFGTAGDPAADVASAIQNMLMNFDSASRGHFNAAGGFVAATATPPVPTSVLTAALDSLEVDQIRNAIMLVIPEGEERDAVFAELNLAEGGAGPTAMEDITTGLADITGPGEDITSSTANQVLTAITDLMHQAVSNALRDAFSDPFADLSGAGNTLANTLMTTDVADVSALLGGEVGANVTIEVPGFRNGNIGSADGGTTLGAFRDALRADLEGPARQAAVLNSQRKFHIGANSGQQVGIGIPDSTADALFNVSDRTSAAGEILDMVRNSVGAPGVTPGNAHASLADAVIAAISSTEAFAVGGELISAADARNMVIDAVDASLAAVSERRSDLGALQNRLEHTIRNLDVASENLLSAEARIRDVDMASEVMEQTRTNILQQAAQSMLAMANQQPQSVLQLLG